AEAFLQLNNRGDASWQSQHLGQAVLGYRQGLDRADESDSREDIISRWTDLVNLLLPRQRHLRICDRLLHEAMRLDPNDRNTRRLKDRVDDELQVASANGAERSPVTGTVQDYAASAYKLLES